MKGAVARSLARSGEMERPRHGPGFLEFFPAGVPKMTIGHGVLVISLTTIKLMRREP